MTKQFLIILSFFLVNISVYGQLVSVSVGGQYEGKNIFEIGKPVTSCERNFENLFANWGPRFVTNYDSIKLISWRFVETLTDEARINSRINFHLQKFYTSGFAGFSQSTRAWAGYSVETGYSRGREFRIHPFYLEIPQEIPQEIEYKLQLELQQRRDYFRTLFQIGDKVFEVKLTYDDTVYIVYVYSRPDEHGIFFDLAGFTQMRELY